MSRPSSTPTVPSTGRRWPETGSSSPRSRRPKATTTGTRTPSPTWRKPGRPGCSTIAYAFAIPNGNGSSASPVTQANYLLGYLGTSDAPVPVVLDIEYNPYGRECYGLSAKAMVAWIASFDSEVQARTGRLPVIYTTAGWWHTCTAGSTAFGQTPMWVAGDTSAGRPALPAGWGNWAIWQYTSAGTVPGIDAGAVDLDQLNPGLVALLDPGGRDSAGGSPVAFGISQPDPVSGQAPSFSAAGLPPGVSISAGGQITGWPGPPGAYHPTITAALGATSGSVSFPWTVTVAPGNGPSGPVALDLSGKCLNDVGNRSANDTQADIWTCNGSAAQRWTSVPDGTLRIHGRCLAAPATTGNATVELKPCTGAAAQQWWLTYPRSISTSLGATPTALLNPASGRCLADPGRSRANGTRVVAGSCNGSKDQAWTLPAGPVSSQIPGMCMDDRANSTANGTPVQPVVLQRDHGPAVDHRARRHRADPREVPGCPAHRQRHAGSTSGPATAPGRSSGSWCPAAGGSAW